ncbi:tlde1 domain-containing protein [Rhizobium sp. 21-4511-3d]
MAFAVEARESANPFGWAIFGSAKLFRALPVIAAIGLGAAVSTWTLASVATMHSSAMPANEDKSLFADIAIAPKAHAHHNAGAAQALVHVSKFSRLPGQTTVSDRMTADVPAKSSKDMVALMRRRGLSLLAMRNNGSEIASALKQQAETLASAAPVPAVTTPSALPAPVQVQVAAVKAPEPATTMAAAEAMPQPRPTPAASPIETALADGVAASDEPFGLVLSDGGEVPLPMARPNRPKTAANAPETALAYAKVDDEDIEDDMPKVGKPTLTPIARAGVAVYDISAGTVYMPNGDRLEAHSGLGNMRDNPRFVDQKMRGPTPPHTYNLQMREALFHGVEAIRLHPVGGAGAIHNRVGLLAHTYMLGKRGDSNGCVSFKDYKRFLAAFKRGEIKQLVVVPKYSGTSAGSPKSTLASLFSRRS